MATVNQIVTFVARQALNDDQPDVELQERIVDYMNDAILDMYDRLAQYLTHHNGATQTLTLSSGSGTMATPPYFIRQVVDVTNASVLKRTSIEDVEAEDPALTKTGRPMYYYTEGDTISVYPSADVDLRIRYIPQPTVVAAGDPEEDIPLPKEAHYALKWGTMALMALDERDFGQISLQVAETKYRETLTEVAQRLRRKNAKKITVPYQGF